MPHMKTEKFRKNSIIECKEWLSFVVVSETYDAHTIRYRIDSPEESGVESGSPLKTPTISTGDNTVN